MVRSPAPPSVKPSVGWAAALRCRVGGIRGAWGCTRGSFDRTPLARLARDTTRAAESQQTGRHLAGTVVRDAPHRACGGAYGSCHMCTAGVPLCGVNARVEGPCPHPIHCVPTLCRRGAPCRTRWGTGSSSHPCALSRVLHAPSARLRSPPGARHREGNLETRGKSSPTTKAGPSRSPRAVRHLHESFPTSDPPLRAPHAPAFAFEAERADTRWRTLGPGLLQEVRGACTPCTLLTDALTTPQLHRSRDALPFQILRRNLRGEELVG